MLQCIELHFQFKTVKQFLFHGRTCFLFILYSLWQQFRCILSAQWLARGQGYTFSPLPLFWSFELAKLTVTNQIVLMECDGQMVCLNDLPTFAFWGPFFCGHHVFCFTLLNTVARIGYRLGKPRASKTISDWSAWMSQMEDSLNHLPWLGLAFLNTVQDSLLDTRDNKDFFFF